MGLFTDFVPMKANAALALGLAGVAVLGVSSSSRGIQALGRLLAPLVLLIGLVTLGEYLTGTDLGIDQALARDDTGTLTSFPGRMALLAALSFTFVGTAIWAGSRGVVRIRDGLAVAAGVVSYVAAVGYAFGPEIYGLEDLSSMAAPAALGLLFLAGAILTMDGRGLARLFVQAHQRGRPAFFVVAAALALPFLLSLVSRLAGGLANYDLGLSAAPLAISVGNLTLLGVLVFGLHRLEAADKRTAEAQSHEHQSARDFKGIVERVPDGVLDARIGGDVIYLNPAGVAMLGYDSLEQLKMERPMASAFYAAPEERNRFIAQVKGGDFSEFRTEWLRRDGSKIPVGLRAQLTESADGFHLFGVVRNRVAEEREERLVSGLRKSERMLAEAEIVAGMGSWDFDLETGKIRWSDSLCDLHGVPRGFEPQGLDGALRFYSVPDRQRIASAVEQAVQRGLEYDFEVDARSDAGNALRERVIGKPEAKDGRVVRVHGIVVDVTAAHKAQLAEAALHEQEAQVQQLAALSKLRAEFLNTAAHDLKTPLTPLKLQLGTLKLGKDLTPKQLDSIGLMERNIGRFQLLIDDMLDAARLQAGRLKLRRQAVVLAPLIQEAADSFREAAEKNGLTFQLDIHADITIDGDPAKVMQVVMNLASNAVKYSPNGGVIEVTAKNLESGVILSFKDPGLGMTAEQLAHLFEPFVRLHEAIPNVAKGTGLGMYISKGIVEQHGGQMSATSPGPGKGTTFSVTWTKATVDAPTGAPPPTAAP